ncbi:MAG: Fe-S cluster assembly protein SufD [Verrucomicrobiales bacterium]|nr:Fe-S cluster assembly protein SufD [Verrucomicrobiales bacterium]
MPETLTPPESSLAQTAPAPPSGLPFWFTERATAAWHTFQSLPTPGPKDENWRYSSAGRIPLDSLHAALPANEQQEAAADEASIGLQEAAARFVFLNDRLVRADRHGLPFQIVCEPFLDALEKHGDLISPVLMQQPAELGSEKFAALHLAHVKAGLILWVPKDVVVEQPIEVFHWVTADHSAIFPHTLIFAGENASVTVIDHYRTLGDGPCLSGAVADIVANAGSRVTYAHCQELGEQATGYHLSTATVEKDARVLSFQAQLGAAFSRTENISHLRGAGSHSDMLSVAMPIGNQIVDQRTLQHHAAPHSFSDLLYKNALYDTSRTVFSGLITVDEGAHYTDAYQTCRNLLNSAEAEANSMPGLEINADQVKCSHGSTSGPVSEEELFYLKARGIPDAAARKLIVQGFLEGTLSRLDHAPLRALIEQRIEEKLSRLCVTAD